MTSGREHPSPTMTAPSRPGRERRAHFIALIARVRRALGARAAHLPHGYALVPALDPDDDFTKWGLVSETGDACWLSARAVEACGRSASRYPLRLWGVLPVRLEVSAEDTSDDRLALVVVRGLAYPSDHRVGSTELHVELHPVGSGPVVLLAPSPIPGWPSTVGRE